MAHVALTPKQEKFCQCIVSGMSGKDIYIAAYNCNSDRVAYNESNVLLKRDDISEPIEELMRPVKNHAINTAISERERIKEKLWEIINNPNANDSDRIRSCDVLNRMNSEYINIQRIESGDTPIQDLDTNKLIELTKIG